MKHQQRKLSTYKHLLVDYHGALNLMSSDALEHLDTKLDDSMMYSQVIAASANESATLVDVGSGAGLPGIPVAIALPHMQIHLVERRRKRATFLRIVKSKLELENVTVYAADVASLTGLETSFVTALAVGTFLDLYCLTRHLHGDTVTILSRKGESWRAERDRLVSNLGAPLNSSIDYQTSTQPLNNDGTLVAVRLAGGLACQP